MDSFENFVRGIGSAAADRLCRLQCEPAGEHGQSIDQAIGYGPKRPQAITAAILRNGHLSNATPDAPDTFAVNLASARVRAAR
jgi:hypothetical protein